MSADSHIPSAERWWDCQLDAQRLAEESVAEAASAALTSAARLMGGGGSTPRISPAPDLARGAFETMTHMRIDGAAVQPWAEFSGFFRARDGFVRLHGNYPHHAEAIRRALRVRTRQDLEQTLARLDAAEAEDAVIAAGGIGTRVRTEAEWHSHPHHIATEARPWVESTPSDALRAAGSPLRVLDLTRVIAGPTCTQMLACLGADVLRVDPPRRPELLDHHLSNGMGKRSAVADLGDSAVAHLVDEADVIVLGYRPGSLDRFGLGVEELSQRYPDKVVASLSAWGETGPWGDRAGFDSIVQAASGIAMRCADSDGTPGALPVQALNFATGYMLAAGILRLVGESHGGTVKASLLGAARRLLSYPQTQGFPTETAFEPLTVAAASPHGDVTLPPPPMRIDGRTVERPIGGYGEASLSWLPRPLHGGI